MEKVELDIEMDSGLITQTRNLALRYFGDEGEASLGRVLELAFRMRYLWSRSTIKGQQETDEPVTSWEFPESPNSSENTDSIGRWLFRR